MYNYYQLTCSIFALSLNIVFLYLICLKSPKKMGNYKYLMIYTSLFEIFFATLDYFAEVRVFTHGIAVMLYRDNSPHPCVFLSVPEALISTYTVSYGVIMGLLASHFVYRYGVTDIDFQHKYTSGWKYYMLLVMPMISGFWYAQVISFLCGKSEEFDDYMRPHILDALDLNIENICYFGFKFYRYNPNPRISSLNLNYTAWLGLANCSIILAFSVFCVMYFGVRCYQKITVQLTASSSTSRFSVNLQKQLFNALVAQTIIPAILVYLPAGAFFLLPIMNIGVGYSSRLITDVIALYPVVDPLPNMFIIQNYRKVIFDFFGCCLKPKNAAPRVVESIAISTV